MMDQEEEHEAYGAEIPVLDDIDDCEDQMDVDMSTTAHEVDGAKGKELDEIKKRLREMEEEAAALLEMQDNIEKDIRASQASEVDSCSIYVGNVEYACTAVEVLQHFGSCGTVNRVTIPTDEFGMPKGFAYVEFLAKEAVQEALRLNGSKLHGRQMKVMAKRTNVSGMKQLRPRRFNPYVAQGCRKPCPAPYMYAPCGHGKSSGFGPRPRYGKSSRFGPRPTHYMPAY